MGITETKEIVNIVAINKEDFDDKFKKIKDFFKDKGFKSEIINITTRKTANSDLILATVRGYINLGDENNES